MCLGETLLRLVAGDPEGLPDRGPRQAARPRQVDPLGEEVLGLEAGLRDRPQLAEELRVRHRLPGRRLRVALAGQNLLEVRDAAPADERTEPAEERRIDAAGVAAERAELLGGVEVHHSPVVDARDGGAHARPVGKSTSSTAQIWGAPSDGT